MSEIYKKLQKIQDEVTSIVKTENNPFFNSKYFDVNAVIAHLKPLLKKNKVVVLQPLIEGSVAGTLAIETMIIDSEMTGDDDDDKNYLIAFRTPIPTTLKPQENGSAITYYRRYALVSFFLLEGELDDDGNIANGNVAKPVPKTIPKTIPKTKQAVKEQIQEFAREMKGEVIPPSQGSGDQKKCPYCGTIHQGKYPKCMDCWKSEQNGVTLTKTKTIINPDEPPFPG